MDHACATGGIGRHALTIVRVVLGVIFFMHGAQKVMGWFGGPGLAGTVQGMTQMGMPVILVYLVSFGEFLGGIGLIVGFLSRIAASGIAIIMIGAIVLVHWPHGFFMNWMMVPEKGHGFEFHLAMIAMALAIILGGPGCCALDNRFCKKPTMS